MKRVDKAGFVCVIEPVLLVFTRTMYRAPENWRQPVSGLHRTLFNSVDQRICIKISCAMCCRIVFCAILSLLLTVAAMQMGIFAIFYQKHKYWNIEDFDRTCRYVWELNFVYRIQRRTNYEKGIPRRIFSPKRVKVTQGWWYFLLWALWFYYLNRSIRMVKSKMRWDGPVKQIGGWENCMFFCVLCVDWSHPAQVRNWLRAVS